MEAQNLVIADLKHALPLNILSSVSSLEGHAGAVRLDVSQCLATPKLLESVVARMPVFLDANVFDEPKSIMHFVSRASAMGAAYISIRCLGGRSAVQAAREGVEHALRYQKLDHRPLLVGSLLPAHIDDAAIGELLPISKGYSVTEMNIFLAKLAREWSLDGVVCPPECVRAIAAEVEDANFLIIADRPDVMGDTFDPQSAMIAHVFRNGASHAIIGEPSVRTAKHAASHVPAWRRDERPHASL